ncbi:MAG: hypothetical protein ACD_38C00140G0005 [uncultured bacterium]|nr:MAG: hypothetical protein ACD_38C00140G0005 [uncultured bacterium]
MRVEKDVVKRVIRKLKGKGQLNINVGQEVTPADIIGTSTVSAGFRTLNLAGSLGVAGPEAGKYLTRKIGQRIYQGELLAFKKNLLFGKKMIISPADGILDFLNEKSGELKIAFIPKKNELPAGVFGICEKVDHERGQAIIRTQVSLIHGLCGTGRLRDGTLHILGKKDGLIEKKMIQSDYQDHILAGGSLFYKETISAAISNGVCGIITGGINASDYKAMAGGRIVFPKKLDYDIGISVVLCEGFGSIPIGEDIFKILSEYEGKFVFIDGNNALINLPSTAGASLVKVRSTRLPDAADGNVSTDEKLRDISELKTGLFVRVLGNSYLGEQGKLIAVNGSPTLLPSGICAYLATIETKRRKIQVPVANLEVIR